MKRILPTLLVLVLPAAAVAGPPAGGWQLDVPVAVTSGSYYQRGAAGSSRLDAVWASAGIELSARHGPWKAALFADRWFASADAIDATTNVGGSVTRDSGRVDWLAALMHSRSQSGPASWLWAGRMRYELAPRHKVGLELAGNAAQPDRSRISLGYWGSVSERLSVRVVYGAEWNDPGSRAARFELSWDLH